LKRRLVLAWLALLSPLTGLVLACSDAEAPGPPAAGPAEVIGPQFTVEELAQRERWEKFLETAEVVSSRQIVGPQAVTSPWVLTLKLGDVTHRGLWKNPEGRMGGYWEGWTYEIAAYRLDKYLGVGLVPPTVERRFHGNRGSCQYWVDDCMSLEERNKKKIECPDDKVPGWGRAIYIQRLFDNLIGNEDRHNNQILITPDWRMILIDHSRSFRTSGKFVRSLLYSAKNSMLMSHLPRALVDKLKTLDAAAVRAAVGEYLTDDEIRAVLIRRDLILAEIGRLVKANGEDRVLY